MTDEPEQETEEFTMFQSPETDEESALNEAVEKAALDNRIEEEADELEASYDQERKGRTMNRLQERAWNQPWMGQKVERCAPAQLKGGWAVGLSLNK